MDGSGDLNWKSHGVFFGSSTKKVKTKEATAFTCSILNLVTVIECDPATNELCPHLLVDAR